MTMNYSYKLTWWGYIYRLEDGLYIPANEGCFEYQEYLDWVAAGNTPEPADPEPTE